MLDFLKSSLSMFFNSEIQACLNEIQEIAGYDLPESEREVFLVFHGHITNPQPNYITALRNDPKKEHWYHLLVNGVLGNAQSSFACVRYHLENLKKIESEIIKAIEQKNYKEALGNSTMALGNTRIWDFEYQAYVLAYRRCLDQFAGALAAFFKNKYSSFRTLPDFLAKQKLQEVANPIIEVHKKHTKNFEFVLSDGGITSVRDRIAHYEFVQAGTINLSSRGLVFVGGGENLNLNFEEKSLLSETLEEKTTALHNCISEMIHCYVIEVTKWQRAQNV
ncbi:hypothetical protein ACPESN_06835 [Stutzerimonas marianensis]|uniref:hypothetical protein n=1 Tax=Stutzerimonas marianensis TaxID=2929513 RepID=UPI003C2B1DBD